MFQPGRLRSGCSRSRVRRPDGHPAAAQAPAPSTTWWSRWPSSGPGPSRADRCTPTSVASNKPGAGHLRLHPLLETEPSAKTLGVPLFQEQLMQMAIDVAGFTPRRRPTSCARPWAPSGQPREAWSELRARLYAGMAEREASPVPVADQIFEQAGRRSPTSASPRATRCRFAYLVLYSSSWIKLLLPGRLLRGAPAQRPAHGLLLARTPWSQDARRHGVEVVTRPGPQRLSRRGHVGATGRRGVAARARIG